MRTSQDAFKRVLSAAQTYQKQYEGKFQLRSHLWDIACASVVWSWLSLALTVSRLAPLPLHELPAWKLVIHCM